MIKLVCIIIQQIVTFQKGKDDKQLIIDEVNRIEKKREVAEEFDTNSKVLPTITSIAHPVQAKMLTLINEQILELKSKEQIQVATDIYQNLAEVLTQPEPSMIQYGEVISGLKEEQDSGFYVIKMPCSLIYQNSSMGLLNYLIRYIA